VTSSKIGYCEWITGTGSDVTTNHRIPSTGQQSTIDVKEYVHQICDQQLCFSWRISTFGFQSYLANFDKSMYGFKALTDASKINVVPDRIKIVSVKKAGTLADAFQSYGVPSNRNKELAVVNGMESVARSSPGRKSRFFSK
jgi:hypothetical protein